MKRLNLNFALGVGGVGTALGDLAGAYAEMAHGFFGMAMLRAAVAVIMAFTAGLWLTAWRLEQ